MTKFNNEILNPGEHFIYNGIEFICLDILDGGNYLAITAKSYDELPFDIGEHNDWRKSSLRRVLNNDFLDLLDKKHLVKQTSDLIADNGDRAYGTCEDYVTILSYDQYCKYKDLVPFYGEWMWTLTPRSCNADSGCFMRGIHPTTVNSSYCVAYYNRGVAPVCVFSSKNLKLRRQAHLVGVDEDGK